MKNVLLMVASVIGLAACGAKAPPCGADSTKKLVSDVIRETLVSPLKAYPPDVVDPSLLQAHSNMPLEIATVTTTGKDEQTGKFTCKGDLVIKDQGLNDYVAAGGAIAKGQSLTIPIEFTSHVTDDGKQQLVEVGGYDVLVRLEAEYIKSRSRELSRQRNASSGGGAGERTVVGNMNVGTSDSALELDGDTSIGFVNDSDAGKAIFAACKSGDRCKVTGVIDSNDNFVTVRSVSKAAAPQ